MPTPTFVILITLLWSSFGIGVTEERLSLRAADEAWAKTAASNDVDEMMSFYVPDAVFISRTVF
jgi:hypothetical protein